MRRTVVGGLFYWTVLIVSACLGIIFMMVPLLPLMFIKAPLFRKVADLVTTFYFVFVVTLMELVYGVKVIITGDRIETSKFGSNLLIMNHRTRLDWMFFWCCLYRYSYANFLNQKISLKDFPLKNLLGLGWATQLAAYIFMKRNFEKDKITIREMLSYYQRMGQNVNLLFFPEGIDKCETGMERSKRYAEANNLMEYEHVLHPRVNGFSYLSTEMFKYTFDSLYDVTVAYKPIVPQDELAILKGKFPEEVHFHITRYRRDSLPDGGEELQQLCKDLWKEKEHRLADFYTKDLRFNEGSNGMRSTQCDMPRKAWQMVSLIYWFSFLFVSIYFVATSSLTLCYVIACAIGLTAIDPLFGGFDKIQTRL
ncbi:lysocardiolipin acyltransferase 1-like isoform X2 [Watersipora subatra]|uniref:lysocardiolipin acyltransferase 1-like isoform X2 n=1 Tax=Watersipora subatra TaxID=2589382 RepID=UPI00355BB93C